MRWRAIKRRQNAGPSPSPGVDLLGIKALEIVGRDHRARALAEAERRNLSASDQFASCTRANEPPAVTVAWYGIDFRPLDTSEWRVALDAVLADPEAPIPDVTPTEPPTITVGMALPQMPTEEGRLRRLAESNAERRARGNSQRRCRSMFE
jgi:hypothetical protein